MNEQKTAKIINCVNWGLPLHGDVHILQSKPIFSMVEPYTRYDREYGKKVEKKLFPFIVQETETKTLVDRRPTDFVQVK